MTACEKLWKVFFLKQLATKGGHRFKDSGAWWNSNLYISNNGSRPLIPQETQEHRTKSEQAKHFISWKTYSIFR